MSLRDKNKNVLKLVTVWVIETLLIKNLNCAEIVKFSSTAYDDFYLAVTVARPLNKTQKNFLS